jgi:TolA-binding protein
MMDSGAVGEQVDQGTGTDPGGGDVSARSVAEHLSSLLLSADSTARRIVEEAEARARQQVASLEQRIREIEGEAVRLEGWRRQTEQMIQSLAMAVEGFRRDMEGVPDRITEALTPLASQVPLVVAQIDQLARTLRTPQPGEAPPDGSGNGPAEAGWHTDWADLAEGDA